MQVPKSLSPQRGKQKISGTYKILAFPQRNPCQV